jgi:hypothetical protein
MADPSGFLPDWLGDLGALLAILSAGYAFAVKDRPSFHIALKASDWGTDDISLQWIVENNSSIKPIRLTKAWCFPRNFVLKTESTTQQNEVVGPSDRAHFAVTDRAGASRHAEWLLVLIFWRTLGGYSAPRLPLFKLSKVRTLNDLTEGGFDTTGPGGRDEG